jgi:hypothetical protein
VVPRRRLLLVLLLLAGIWYQLHHQAPRPAPASYEQDGAASVVFTSTARDLSVDEAAGGHTLARHVGRSDAELAQRLARESSLTAASSFDDRATAERAVGAALAAERDRVDTWLRRERGETLAISWRGGDNRVGRLLERGAATSEPVRGARVVLRRRGAGYFVLTAYPERPT